MILHEFSTDGTSFATVDQEDAIGLADGSSLHGFADGDSVNSRCEAAGCVRRNRPTVVPGGDFVNPAPDALIAAPGP